MKNKFKVIALVILGILISVFTACDKEPGSLMKNEEILEKLKLIEEENISLKQEKEALEDEIIFVKSTLNNTANVKFSIDSIYIKSEEYSLETENNETKFVFNINKFSKTASPKAIIEKENIISFLPSYDNKYIALIIGDDDNKPFEINVCDQNGDKIMSFGVEEFLRKELLNETESLSFTGHSAANEYIYGIVHAPLDVCGFWSIDLLNGELKVYTYDEYEEFEELQEKYPELSEAWHKDN